MVGSACFSPVSCSYFQLIGPLRANALSCLREPGTIMEYSVCFSSYKQGCFLVWYGRILLIDISFPVLNYDHSLCHVCKCFFSTPGYFYPPVRFSFLNWHPSIGKAIFRR